MIFFFFHFYSVNLNQSEICFSETPNAEISTKKSRVGLATPNKKRSRAFNAKTLCTEMQQTPTKYLSGVKSSVAKSQTKKRKLFECGKVFFFSLFSHCKVIFFVVVICKTILLCRFFQFHAKWSTFHADAIERC